MLWEVHQRRNKSVSQTLYLFKSLAICKLPRLTVSARSTRETIDSCRWHLNKSASWLLPKPTILRCFKMRHQLRLPLCFAKTQKGSQLSKLTPSNEKARWMVESGRIMVSNTSALSLPDATQICSSLEVRSRVICISSKGSTRQKLKTARRPSHQRTVSLKPKTMRFQNSRTKSRGTLTIPTQP